ncbi:hypothetical protein [Priestia megaterium]|uniref:hypothetical protein n=1 Tax=Priestia megaterium TaxID=1404 RepID=UPI003101A5AE
MNYPILYSSTHQMSSSELRRYVLAYPEHNANFTILDAYRFITYHKYDDDLCVRFEWFIPKEYRRGFKMPLNVEEIIELEKRINIVFKKGTVISYSHRDKASIPNEHTYEIFHKVVRKERIPLKQDDYKALEYPKYDETEKVKDAHLNKVVANYKLFQEYLLKKRPKKKIN